MQTRLEKLVAAGMEECFGCGGFGGETVDDGWMPCFKCGETGLLPLGSLDAAEETARHLAEEAALAPHYDYSAFGGSNDYAYDDNTYPEFQPDFMPEDYMSPDEIAACEEMYRREFGITD